MSSGVCLVTNNYNGQRGSPQIDGEGIFHIEGNIFTLEGTFHVNKNTQLLIGQMKFRVTELITGNDHDMFLFGANSHYQPLCNSHIVLPSVARDIFYLKFSTGLNPEEERFLRDYRRMNLDFQHKFDTQYQEVQKKIERHMRAEKERMQALLNDQKGYGGGIELF